MNDLPDEIWIHIYSFCKPNVLIKLNLVSKKHYEFTKFHETWINLTTKLWNDKVLFCQDSFIKDNHKKNYYISLRDSKRNEITRKEISSTLWRVVFKGYNRLEQYHNYSKYFEDGTMAVKGLPKMENQEEWIWFLSNNKFQVQSFPPLNIRRNKKNWGWILENENVELEPMSYSCLNYENESVEKCFEKSKNVKDEGNVFFKQKRFKNAIQEYHKALDIIMFKEYDKNEVLESNQIDKLISIILSNMGTCYFMIEEYQESYVYSDMAESYDKNNEKAIIRKYSSMIKLGYLDHAKSYQEKYSKILKK
jgi:tetratricopeptide (TPR) repeat protein